MNLFSVPHTVTEDLARQPGVVPRKITPASVREFLRRSPGDIARHAVAEYFGQGTGNSGGAGGGGGGHGHGGGAPGARASASPDIDLLLELLDFCLSDCAPPEVARPHEGASSLTGGVSGEAAGGTGDGGSGGSEQESTEATPTNAGEAAVAQQVRCSRRATSEGELGQVPGILGLVSSGL